MPGRWNRSDAWMLLALLFLLLAAYRAWQVDLDLGVYTGCRGCIHGAVLAHDLWLLVAWLAAYLLTSLWPRPWLGWPLALASAGIALAFVVDIVVQRLLSRRLLWLDVQRYGDDLAGNLSVLLPWAGKAEGAAILLAGLLLVLALALAMAARAANPCRLPWAVALVLCLLMIFAEGPPRYMNRLAIWNVLEINQPDGMTRNYGTASLQALQAVPAPAAVCQPGLGRRMSVIVLVVESLSLHHSRLFSGLADRMPGMDALASEGSWFPEFYANGYSTEGGLIALLTGKVPISTLNHHGVLVFHDVQSDFHRQLVANGYRNRFFTTGTLAYAERERWLRSIGIEEAEGDQHPFYDGMRRGPFNAASDRALVDRFLQWYDHERGTTPFFATLLTVGMHPPYSGAGAEQAAVRAGDAAIFALARGLRQRGYLDENLLLVVGDHRAMTPISRKEHQRFGETAVLRVPAFVLGASGLPKGRVAGAFQQTDLLPSLQYLMAEQSCRDPLQGLMFGPRPTPARVQLLGDPMRYDRMRARVDGHEHVLVLDGDDSHWLGREPALDFDLKLEVARQRLARDHPAPQDR